VYLLVPERRTPFKAKETEIEKAHVQSHDEMASGSALPLIQTNSLWDFCAISDKHAGMSHIG